MPYFICDTIGTGADAEGNQIRPALALHSDTWTCTADAPGLGRMLVRAAHLPAFDSDSRIRPLRRALLSNVAPDDGETDDWEAPELARKVARRFLVRQWLGLDDFAVNAGALDLTLGDIPTPRRRRIRDRLLSFRPKPIDITGLGLSTSIADALRFILPQIAVRLDPRPMSPSGTFTDAFTAGANTNLEDWTPTGGTAWTKVDGAAGSANVRDFDDRLAVNNTDTNGGSYQCDDQGSVDHYVQFTLEHTNLTCFGGANRLVDNGASGGSGFVGVRVFGTKVEIFKKANAVTTQLGTSGATVAVIDDTVRMESSGNDHTAYLEGVAEVGPSSDTINNTVTRQGLVARNSGLTEWLDNFEAGVLAGGGGGLSIPIAMYHYRHHLGA